MAKVTTIIQAPPLLVAREDAAAALGKISESTLDDLVRKGLLPPPRIFGHETAGIVAAVGEGGDGGEADGAAAEHRDAVVRAHVGLVGGMHAHRKGLGEGGHVEGNVVRDRVEEAVGLWHQEQRGEAAPGRAAADAAGVLAAGLHDHPVAHPHERVAGTGVGVRDVVDADVAGTVHSNLLHRDLPQLARYPPSTARVVPVT